MKRYCFFLLCVLLGLPPAQAAAPAELSGRVISGADGSAVAGAVVKAKGAFTSTGADGRFRLRLKAEADSVSFRCIGYESLTLPADADMSAVSLRPKATQLNDVIVEAPDIYARGDTLVFNVSKYANAKDNAIIDVIKRLPGIKVEEDGTIKYQGKPINKFYIDGNDFFGGQYGLATNNISHKDVKSVEVMERHQPVKALEGIEFPEEAGINLKLKEDARSRWAGVAQAAAGAEPLLYDASLFMMRIAPKIQNMFTVKADNTGWNPAGEIKEHGFTDIFASDYSESLWPEYISADAVDSPLPEKRTRDNLSWLADAISAWKSGETSMRLKTDYSADRLDYNSSVSTEYPGSSIPDYIFHNRLHTQNHSLSASFHSETNRRDLYLNDHLTIGAEWDNSESDVSGSNNLLQRISRRRFEAKNDLRVVKRNDKRLFTISSRNSFVRRPDRLFVKGDEDAIQRLGTTDLRSTTETRIGKLTRFLKYYLTAGIDLNINRMATSLAGMNTLDNSEVYNSFLSNIYVTPQMDYDRRGWRLSVRMPAKWLHQSVVGSRDYINLSPLFHARRQLTAKSEISASLTYKLGTPQPYLNIEAPIMADYRNIFVASNPDRYSHSIGATTDYRYRNPLKSLFFNASAGYNHSSSSIMPNQLFIGDLILSTYADRLNRSDTWHFNGGMSKGVGRSKMVAGFEANVSLTAAESMRNDEAIPFRQFTAGIKPYLKGNVVRWLSVNYEGDYRFSSLEIGDDGSPSHSFRHNLFATVIPSDIVQFTAGAEQFLTRFPEGNTAGMILLDASAIWSINNRTRLTVTATNLLDRRKYEYVTYGTLSRSERSFRVRPRNILASLQVRF